MSGSGKKYKLKERQISLNDEYDVIVVGGGPAGCAAATAAARAGAKTFLIERNGALGGMGTLGLVPWFCGYDDGKNIIARGLAEHVRLALCQGMPLLKKWISSDPLCPPAIAPELLKRIYDDLVTRAGAKVLFFSQLCSVEMSDGG
ncbi:MAG: FAD-dependent oxidoreductase, partial [Lentisphaerota bacterium]